jgi:glycerophosphoryl diester phosphodiesterase
MMGRVPPRLPSLNGSAETFAQIRSEARGDGRDPADAPSAALALGATGIDSPAWLTADGVAVLHPTGAVGSRLRRRALRSVPYQGVERAVVSLERLCRQPVPPANLLLDIADDRVLGAVLDVVRQARPDLEANLWLCSADLDSLVRWREATTAKLVNRIRLTALDTSPEQRVARLASRSIDVVCAHHTDWTAGLVALVHRFERSGLARGAQHERELVAVFDIGLDAVSSPQMERMMAVATLYYPDRYPPPR